LIYDMLGDPYERGKTSIYYNPWFIEHLSMQYAAAAPVAQWLQSFKRVSRSAEARQLSTSPR
jgi:arylsulfatase